MKLVSLMENSTCRSDLICEHGLSLYIEANGRKILFDAGQSAAFADNAEKLGVDLAAVDTCILSHGHYDHGGGLMRFLEINSRAAIYMSPHAFEEHWHGPEKYIGLDRRLMDSERIVYAQDGMTLGNGLTLHTTLPCREIESIDSAGLTVLEGSKHLPEDFRHEQYLTIAEGGQRILISGCSHRGILNLAEHFQPDVLIGGFHLMKMTDECKLAGIAHRLAAQKTVYYTGHCTGDTAYAAIKGVMGERLHALHTGSLFEIV